MPSTYTLNNGIELIATGEQSGTWGDTTNVNLGLIDTALDGQVTITLAAAGTSGSPNTLPISDGSASNGRNRLVIFDDGGDLGATAFVQLTPNDAEKIVYIRNNLSGGRAITLFQGTYNASNDYEVPAGTTAIVFFNGGGAGAVAANVFNNAFFDSLRLGGVSVTAILDEDNMASDSATALATQQSIKAYVDAQVGANNELSEVLANGNTSGGNNIQMTTTDEVQFRDTALTISSSVDGQLDIAADVELEIVAPTLDINASTAVTIDTTTMTMTGSVNVVGDLDVDNLNINGNSIISTNTDGNITLDPNGTGSVAVTGPATISGNLTVDTNTLFVDAANNRVGVGTSSPERQVTINSSFPVLQFTNPTTGTTSNDGLLIFQSGLDAYFSNQEAGPTIFETNNTERTRIDSLGVLTNQIGAVFNESGADSDFRVESDTNTHMLFVDAGLNKVGIGSSDTAGVAGNGLKITSNSIGSQSAAALALTGTGGDFYSHIIYNSATDYVTYVSISSSGTNAIYDYWTDAGRGFTNISRHGQLSDGSQEYTPTTGAFFVWNQEGVDADFRVESDTNTHALFVDAGANVVGVGLSSTTAQATTSATSLNVGGVLSVEGTLNSHQTNKLVFERNGNVSAVRAYGATAGDGVFRIQVGGGGGSADSEVARFEASTVTFNENSTDADFRVESDTQTHALFVDASENRVFAGGLSSGSVGSAQFIVNAGNVGSLAGDTLRLQQWYYGTGNGSFFGHKARRTDANGVWTGVVVDTVLEVDNSADLYTYITYGIGNLVFNEAGNDIDFRVESDTNTHMLFVDAGNDAVGIVASTSDAALNIGFKTGGKFIREYHAVSYNANSQLTLLEAGINDTAVDNTRVYQWRHYLEADNPGAPAGGHNYKIQALARLGSYTDVLTLGGTGSYAAAFHRGLAVNEDGADSDFRVESDTNTHALFVDAGTSSVVAGTSASLGGRIEAEHLGFSNSGNNNWKKGAFVAKGSFGGAISLVNGGGASDGFAFYLTGTPSVLSLQFGANGGTMSAGVQLSSTATSWAAFSDARLKTVTSEISGAVSSVNSLRAVNYTFNSDDANTPRVGLIAQEVQAVLPEAVDVIDEDGHLGLRYTEVIPLLVAAIKEQQATIETLEARIAALETA